MARFERPDIHNSVGVGGRAVGGWRGSVRVAAGHLSLDELLHEQILLDSTPQLVGLGGVQVHELLELERQLARGDPSVIQIPAQEGLVHPAQVLRVQQVLVAEEALVDLQLGGLELGWRS